MPNHLYLILVTGDNHLKEKPVHLLRHLIGAAILLTVTAGPALADGLIVPFVGFNFGGDSGSGCLSLTNCKEKRTNFGVSLTSMGTVFGLEEDISYAKNFFGETPGQSNSVFSAMTNLVIGPGVGPVRPYVVGGIGLIRPHVSSLASSLTTFSADKNAFGYDLGGGLTILFGSRVGIRGDLRHFHTMQNVNVLIFTGQKLDFWRASAGLALAF
jgi:opacity protein-like surface antigen